MPRRAAPECCRAGNKELCGEWKEQSPSTGEWQHRSKVANRMGLREKKKEKKKKTLGPSVTPYNLPSDKVLVSNDPFPLEHGFSFCPIHFGLDHVTCLKNGI